jgi:general secretion pathway protein I
MRDEAGFTLLETLVALAIAALVVSVFVKECGVGLTSVGMAGRYEEAVSRAKSHLAALRSDTTLVVGEFTGEDGDGYRWRVRVQPVASSKPASGGAATVTLYAIEVTVSWKTDRATRDVALRTEWLARGVGS